jgi:CcmD family protein
MVAAGSAATSGLALSRPAPAQAAAQEPQDQFVPVRSLPQAEQLPAAPLLMTAYAFVWAALLVYVWTLWRRVLKVEREMRDLSARISEVPRGK